MDVNVDKEAGAGLPQFSVDDEGIGTIRLNNPARLNSLSPQTFTRLGEIFAEIRERAHADVSAVVLTGTGRGFCAGAELSSMFQKADSTASPSEPGQSVGRRIASWTRDEGTPVVMAWNDLPVPLIVAVNGVTAGIGLSLALSGDVVVAARSANFSVPFMTVLGIVPDGGLTWQLPRLVGHARSLGLSLLGERISAEEAERWGLIWRCVDDALLEQTTRTLALRLTRLPTYAIHELRQVFRASYRNDFGQQYDLELSRNTELLDGAAFQEGIEAFLEKRQPQFRSR